MNTILGYNQHLLHKQNMKNKEITVYSTINNLFVVAIFIILADVEVTELVSVLVDSDNSQPVTKRVSLEVLLSKVLQISKQLILEGN